MMVKKPIGPIRIDGTLSRLAVGRPVPETVLRHWKDTGQLSDLQSSGAISEENASTGATAKKNKIERVSAERESVRESESGQQEDSE
jgi:hypothetical protein